MRIISKATTSIFIFLIAALTACEAKESSDPTRSAVPLPYPVMDSGAWADWNSYTPTIYWIDNNRVIFKTVKDNDKSRVSSGPFNLSIWDITTNKVTPYTPHVNSLNICYSEGYIYYSLADEPFHVQKKNWRHFAGEFGKEKPYAPPIGKNVIYNELSCRFQESSELVEKRKTRRIRPLLGRHGYLDRGAIREKPGVKEPVILYRTSHSKGIELPIHGRDAIIIRHYPFKDAYFIQNLNTGGIPNKKKQFWWLFPDGKVEEGLHPVEFYLYPTRQGIVTDWGGTKSAKDPGTVGLYLWSGKEPVKIIAGYAEGGVATSPDGCKLAFANFLYSDATKIKDPGRITLKAINVCVEEKNHGQ